MASVTDIAKSLNRSWKREIITKGNFIKQVNRLSIGDLGFDYPLYGGLPEGCLVVFSGLEHSGKTVAACLAVAQYQKQHPDKMCIYVDAENTLQTQGDFLHKMTGIDLDHLMRYNMTGIAAEEMFKDIIKFQEESDDIGMIVIDSAPALISKADLDNDFEKDNGQRATIAKTLGKFTKRMIMTLPQKENLLLIINQVRVDGVNFVGAKIYSEPCGYSLNYYPSMKVRFGTRTYTKGDKTDISSSKGEGADGFRLKFSITKNRLGATDRGGGFLTFRYAEGLDCIHDMLEVAMTYGYIKRPTTQSYLLINLDTGEVYTDESGNELKFVGKQKLIEYIKTNDAFREEYFAMLTKHVSNAQSSINLLDKKSMDEILTQEAVVMKNTVEDDAPDEDEEQDE